MCSFIALVVFHTLLYLLYLLSTRSTCCRPNAVLTRQNWLFISLIICTTIVMAPPAQQHCLTKCEKHVTNCPPTLRRRKSRRHDATLLTVLRLWYFYDSPRPNFPPSSGTLWHRKERSRQSNGKSLHRHFTIFLNGPSFLFASLSLSFYIVLCQPLCAPFRC